MKVLTLVTLASFLLATLAVGIKRPQLNGVPPAPGTPEMKALFAHAPTYVPLNHGSFGSPPHYVLDANEMYSRECELRPDQWFRGGMQAHMDATRPEIAKYINAEARDVVYVENASSGVNAVMRSLQVKAGDIILYLSTAYGMVKNTADYLRQIYGVTILEIPVRFLGNGTAPVDIQGRPVVEAVKDVLREYDGRIRIAFFSHISSVPAWILPVEEISRACNASDVPVFIDGAHALGQIPVDVQALEAAGVSYWVGNAHKWLYSPKGSAVMWVARWAQDGVAPTVISSAYKTGVIDEHNNFQNHFQYTGTRSYTAFCAIKDSLTFRNWVGESVIMDYNHNLAVWAQNRLAEIWNTETLLPPELTAFMGHARFPVSSADEMGKIDSALLKRYDTEVTTFPLVDPVTNGTTYWIRLSAQIYLSRSEIETMAFRVLELKREFGF